MLLQYFTHDLNMQLRLDQMGIILTRLSSAR